LAEGEDYFGFGRNGLAIDGGWLKAPNLHAIEGHLIQGVSDALDKVLADDVAASIQLHVDDHLFFGGRQQGAIVHGGVRVENGKRHGGVLGVAAIARN
jgi:hypothetical protein